MDAKQMKDEYDTLTADITAVRDERRKLLDSAELPLKSKISAIMEVLKCDEETARKEYEKIISESRVSAGIRCFWREARR